MKILFPSSNWASNIGNPFFGMGAKYLISRIDPSIEVIDTASNPSVPYGLKGRSYNNAFVYANYLGLVDAVMLCGPIFDKQFAKLYEPLLSAAADAKIKTIFLTVGGMAYDDEEVQHCRRVLKKYPPAIMATRDRQTYNNYGDLCENSYSGICAAWFTPEAYPGYETPSVGKYFTLTYDFGVEPPLQQMLQAIGGAEKIHSPQSAFSILRSASFIVDRGNPESLEEYKIIRPQHRLIRPKTLLFRNPNSFCAFTPHGYLNLYRNTAFTITDRLHAAVATLAYGNPAYLFLKSNRTYLLDAADIKYEAGKIMKINAVAFKKTKEDYIGWLIGAFAKVRNDS